MTDKTHQMIGLSAATAAFFSLHPSESVTLITASSVVIGAFFGSLAPDIDQPTSDFWDTIPLGSFIGKVASRALGGHRNLSHSLLGIALFSALILWLTGTIPESWPISPQIAAQSFIIGFIAHLAADSVTVRGIPLFWPLGDDMGFPPYPLDGIRIITGKWFENLVVFPLSIIVFLILIATHFNRFCSIIGVVCHR